MEPLLLAARQQLLAALAIFLASVDDMRDLRNRIAHEYLPGEMAKTYTIMVGEGAAELARLRQVVEHLQ